jgi:hypothetical protein
MQRFTLAILLAVSLVSSVKAQETTGERAEEAKKEIIKIELVKLPDLLKNGSAAADWFDRNNADGVVLMSDGAFHTKAQQLASLRSQELYLLTNKQYGHRVRVYNDGNMAVCSYLQEATFKRKGQPVTVHNLGTDVWVKFEDGMWQRVVHTVEPALTESTRQPQ